MYVRSGSFRGSSSAAGGRLEELELEQHGFYAGSWVGFFRPRDLVMSYASRTAGLFLFWMSEFWMTAVPVTSGAVS